MRWVAFPRFVGSRFGPGSKPLPVVTRRRWFRNKPNRGARGSGTQAPHRPLSKSLFLTIQSFTFHSSGSPSLRDRGWSSHSVWVRVVLPMRVAGLDVAGRGLCRVLFFCALLTPRVKRDKHGSTWERLSSWAKHIGGILGSDCDAFRCAQGSDLSVGASRSKLGMLLHGQGECDVRGRMVQQGPRVPFIRERQTGSNFEAQVQSLIH